MRIAAPDMSRSAPSAKSGEGARLCEAVDPTKSKERIEEDRGEGYASKRMAVISSKWRDHSPVCHDKVSNDIDVAVH